MIPIITDVWRGLQSLPPLQIAGLGNPENVSGAISGGIEGTRKR